MNNNLRSWSAHIVRDGHDVGQLVDALLRARGGSGDRPQVIIAKTVTTKGIPPLEGRVTFGSDALNPPVGTMIANSLRELDGLSTSCPVPREPLSKRLCKIDLDKSPNDWHLQLQFTKPVRDIIVFSRQKNEPYDVERMMIINVSLL